MEAAIKPFENIQETHRAPISDALLRLRRNLADGSFLRTNFYTDDESKFAGNTHHYWIRWGLTQNPRQVIEDFLPAPLPSHLADWLKSELEQKIIRRLPVEYSTLIKIPFKVALGEVADERAKRTDSIVRHRLPTVIPYAIFFLEINRLLRSIGAAKPPPNKAEFSTLLSHYCKNAMTKARHCFPEVWDELRGHYLLDSRGSHFAKRLVKELNKRNLLTTSTKFIDIGSGIGTNVFAVNHYSAANATGIEIHAGLLRFSNVIKRRLHRLGQLESQRIDFLLGDALDSDIIDLSQYDVFYVYSPIGKMEIDIDKIVDDAKPGAVIIFNRLPVRNRLLVKQLDNVAGLIAFRKIASAAID